MSAGRPAMIVLDGVVSMLFFWPRNEIMFVEGAAVHSAEVLSQTAREFQTLHWSRLAFNAASAVFAFAGFVAFDRQRILGQVTCQANQPNAQPVRRDGAATSLA